MWTRLQIAVQVLEIGRFVPPVRIIWGGSTRVLRIEFCEYVIRPQILLPCGGRDEFETIRRMLQVSLKF
jgi:hypothetical protein